MKKRKILFGILSLVLLVGVIVGAMSMSASAARGTGGTINTSTDWLSAPAKTLVKCQGGSCTHENCDYAYSFAVIGDTQNLNLYYDVRKGTSYLKGIYQWILDNQDSKNIQYVMGVGDITQSWNRDYGNDYYAEWINAAEALALLDGKIDYSLVRGNHDFSDAIDGFNGVFGVGDKLANGVDNQYYETLLEMAATTDKDGNPKEPTAGFRIDERIEETWRKVTMGNQKYIIITLDWHPMSRETDCVKDAKNLCKDETYCYVHYNTSKECSSNASECKTTIGCKHHNSYVNGKTFCNYELCSDDCAKHDTFGWLDNLLTVNSDCKAIITMHSFIMRDGSTVDDIEDVFPYENVNNSSRPLWHEVAATGGNATPKQLWDEVLSNHANVSMLFCGHVDEDNIVTTQLRGKNGNTVTCQLIDGQTIDSKQEPVGLVAMYYISADGTVANVEYISTVRAAAGLPAYLRAENQFELNLDYGNAWTKTEYGYIPTEIYNEYTFHIMLDDDSNPATVNTLYGSYNTWEETLLRANELREVGAIAARQQKTYNIVMSKDYTYKNEYTSSQLDHNQSCNNPSKIVLDLNGKTFSLASGTTFLPMYNAKKSFKASFTVKNGTMLFNGSARGIVTQHGHPTNASGSVVDINLSDLTVKYASGAKGNFVLPFSMTEKSDTRSTVNLNVTNCTIDASETGAVLLFNLNDNYNDSDVNLNISGGSIIGSTTANTTFVKQNYPGDSITFLPGEDGNYTTFTYTDNAQLNGVFYSETSGKNVEFAAPVAKDGKYVSTLVSSTGILTKYGPIPSAYADAQAYPWALFKDGTLEYATNNWYTLIDTTIKGTEEYHSGCTLLLRRDYDTTEGGKGPEWFAYIDDLTIDLDQHVFTRGSYHMIQLFGTETTAHVTNITINNGTIRTITNTAPFVYNNANSNTGADELNMVLNNVTFDLSTTVTGTQGVVVAFGDGIKLGLDSTITFNDCTFYRGSVTRKMTLFSLIDEKDGKVNNKTDSHIIINGGKLVADSLANLTFASFSPERETGKGSPDTITFGKGSDGKAFEIVLPSTYTAPTSAYALTGGTHYVAKLADNGDGTITYNLDCAETAYGKVTQAYASIENYPFAVFYNGAFKKGYATLSAAVSAAVELTNTQEEIDVCDTVYIAMRRDFVSEASANFVRSRGKIIIDLQGYQLSSSTAYLTDGFINYSKITESNVKEHLEKSSEITFKNGTIKNNRSEHSLFNVGASDKTVLPDAFSSYSRKHFIYNFDGVTFKSSAKPMMHAWNHSGLGFDIDVNVNECTFDFTSTPEGVAFFSCADTNNIYAFNLSITGCSAIASKLDSYKLYSLGANDKATIGADDNGIYLTVTQTTEVVPASSFTADDGKSVIFYPSVAEGGKYSYVLMASSNVETEYGEIPADKADVNKYPLVLFEGNAASGYTVVDYYSDFAVLLTKIAGALGKDYTVLVRADYTKTTKKYVGNFTGSLTIDLDGHTFTIVEDGNYLLDLGVGNAKGPKGTFNIKNGTIVKAGGRGIVCMNYDSNLKTNDAEYTFGFSDVTFISKDSTYNNNVIFTTWEGAYENATAKIVMNSTFDNCTFDYRNSISGVVMLDLGHSSKTKDRVQHNVVINGGTVLANSASDIDGNFVKLDGNANGRADSIKFGANANGEYVTLVLPDTVAASALKGSWTTADGSVCVFVKTSENAENVNYTLYPAVMVGYKIKTSVTLWSNFVYNIYMPVTNFNSVKLNGVAVNYKEVEIDGVLYYHVAVSLPAGEALSDMALTVTLNSGESTVSANWTLNVLKYTTSVLNDNFDDTTKTLMKDMLAYASAAHTYFENTASVSDKLAEIATLLNGYSVALPKGEAKKPESNTYFTDVAVNVGAVPSFRFYLAEGYTIDNFTFTVGNRNANATLGNDEKGDYLEITMYAYMMLDDVTYTVVGTDVSESYNLYSYHAYATSTSNANLVAVVEALMKYSVSATNYRNAVIGA